MSSEPDLLRDEFGVQELRIIDDNEIVRVDKDKYESFHIGKSEAKVEVKLKPGFKTFFV